MQLIPHLNVPRASQYYTVVYIASAVLEVLYISSDLIELDVVFEANISSSFH